MGDHTTKEFIKRNGEFTINVALVHRDRPVMGIIYTPVNDVLYDGAYKVEQGTTNACRSRQRGTGLLSSAAAARDARLKQMSPALRKHYGDVTIIRTGSPSSGVTHVVERIDP